VELGDFRDMLEEIRGGAMADKARRKAALQLVIAKCDDRLSALTDALLDGTVDKGIYEAKKSAIIHKRRQAMDEIEFADLAPSRADLVAEYLELSLTAETQYKSGISEEIRDIVCRTTSNLSGQSNYPIIALKSPFREMLNVRKSQVCADRRDDGRTIVEKIFASFVSAAEKEIEGGPHTRP
jgi:hypothetical protein